MKRKIPEIHESLEELTERYKSEHKPRKKERLLMLYLLKSQQVKTMKKVAAILIVDRNTIGAWLRRYECEGLEGLLDIRTKPNNASAIPPDILSKLHEKLHDPQNGFQSYKAIGRWLQEKHNLTVPAKTVYHIVRYKLKAKLKVPRKSHYAKDEERTQHYKSHFTQTIHNIVESQHASLPASTVHLAVEDESRFGLQTIQRRCITVKGVKPVGTIQHAFENYYLYGVVEPVTGGSFFLEMPALDSACFQVFLEQFAAHHPDELYIIILDGGTFHKAKYLHIPDNIVLEFLPPYSPELNPIERLWQDIKDRIANKVFETLGSLKDSVASIVKNYTAAYIQSLTGYTYVLEAVNAVIQ